MTNVERGTVSGGYRVDLLRQREFPWADRTIYLNHAGIGPLPERARIALEEYGRARAEAYRLTDEHMGVVLARSRALAARLINADTTEIALATNTSYGINLAALSLPLGPGDVILVSHGEFPANVFPWRELARKGVELELIPVTAEGWPDEARMLERIADPRVKVLAISLVQFHTAYLADIATLSAACRAHDTFLVLDAIQGLGQIPFDVGETPVDILTCGAQKWLLSPWGSGFAYFSRKMIETVEPAIVGWTAFEGTDDYTSLCRYEGDWRRDARRFEMITLPFQDFVGMNASFELLLELGIGTISTHLEAIGRPVIEWAQARGVRIASPLGAQRTGMICLVPDETETVFDRLTAAGVVASYREGSIRLSPHCYNTVDEMARVADVLDRSL